ncbi:MAG: UDP-N-acetylmuramoyl-L-alanine--D-glutamate ligase, partial [Alphaproteobacteria bacterium]
NPHNPRSPHGQTAQHSPRIAAITGTDGKSTTAVLLTQLLQAGGKNAIACGNLGIPVLAAANQACENPNPIYVLELSSYQLTITPSLAAEVAILVSLAPDHIDWHGSLENYLNAKRAVFNNADRAVIGVDDELSVREANRLEGEANRLEGEANRLEGEANRLESESSLPCVRVSGRFLPTNGVGVRGDTLCNQNGDLADFPVDSPFSADHNRLAAAAASAAASLLGAPQNRIGDVLNQFQGLPHRYEPIGQADSVSFINDSKATTVHAASAALLNGSNIFWIAGGVPKGQDFNPLFNNLTQVQSLYAIGEAAPLLVAAAQKKGLPAQDLQTLQNAFNAATTDAQKFVRQNSVRKNKQKAIVLLSPACASFDSFSNFAQRGDEFRKLATHWLAEKS